jgi:NADPH:quinone reductase-like Zn-dependent oxidoreductase
VRAFEIRGGFGLDRLELVDRPVPEAGAGQVLLHMRAASLNYRDLLTVTGRYNPKQPLPLVPCSDGVGQVVAVGAGVTRVREGDRVIPIFAQRWISGAPTRDKLRSTLGGPADGTLAEYMVLNEDGVVRAPDDLSDAEAATLPCSGVTAWNALVGEGPLRPGSTVLVQGTGGVSVFALQIARLAGARVIVTSSSEEKLERARALGAWHTIRYTRVSEWGVEARRLTGGVGVDVVVDVGGTETLVQSLAAVAFGGQVSLVGNLTGGAVRLDVVPIFMRQVRLQGILVGHREALEAFARAVAVSGLRPVVDRVFPLDETRAALEHLRSGGHFGKVCIGF